MASDLVAIESRLWAAADQPWANTGLKPAEFSTPVLGLIFLRYADKRFGECDQALDAKGIPPDEREAMDYQAEGVLYLPLQARFSHLLTLTEGANLGRAIATAMELVEAHNPELHGVLPRGYNLLPQGTPSTGNANYLWIQRCAAGLAELFIDARPYFKGTADLFSGSRSAGMRCQNKWLQATYFVSHRKTTLFR